LQLRRRALSLAFGVPAHELDELELEDESET